MGSCSRGGRRCAAPLMVTCPMAPRPRCSAPSNPEVGPRRGQDRFDRGDDGLGAILLGKMSAVLRHAQRALR